MKKALFLLLAFLSLAVMADVLQLKMGTQEGMFSGYSKSRLHFQGWEGEKEEVYEPAKVNKLVLDKPMKVQVFLTRSPKKPISAMLKGFDNMKFTLEMEGSEKVIHCNQITKIDCNLSIGEYMKRRDAAKNGGQQASVKEMLEEGMATVIHFHCDDGPASQRQGNLCERLCKDSKGKAVYKRIVVKDLNDPIAKRYKLQSLPQFWFYTPKKSIFVKLSERFTEEDIEKALKGSIRAQK
jgi:hypothetical protein